MTLKPIALVCALLAATFAPAQQPTLPTVPTTRILAIGRLTPGTTREKIMPILKQQEVPDTLRLYLDGKLDQMFSRTDKNGVVFILNVTTVEQAQAILDKLPLGQARLMDFDLIPLGPLSPLALLLQATPTK